jgi:hypothetical protein
VSDIVKTLIHVGFCHSGTTSLQQNFFSRRRDIFFCSSFGHYGGILSYVKYEEDWTSVERHVEALCEKYIWTRIRSNQRFVVSDETLVEQPEVYYTPHKMPTGVVAQRLKQLFPRARVLFTLRNQFDYIASCYFNLKRNYAYLADRCIEDFDTWFAGNHSQISNQFLRNLDYSRAIAPFVTTFGKDSVAVLPLETLKDAGEKAYLQRIGELLDLEVGEQDAKTFQPVRNRRISRGEDRILTQWHDPFVRRRYAGLVRGSESDRLALAVDSDDPATVDFNDAQIAMIRQRCAEGNRRLEKQFGLSLSALGYPTQSSTARLRTRLRAALGRAIANR